jgi:hypothetical protein
MRRLGFWLQREGERTATPDPRPLPELARRPGDGHPLAAGAAGALSRGGDYPPAQARAGGGPGRLSLARSDPPAAHLRGRPPPGAPAARGGGTSQGGVRSGHPPAKLLQFGVDASPRGRPAHARLRAQRPQLASHGPGAAAPRAGAHRARPHGALLPRSRGALGVRHRSHGSRTPGDGGGGCGGRSGAGRGGARGCQAARRHRPRGLLRGLEDVAPGALRRGGRRDPRAARRGGLGAARTR